MRLGCVLLVVAVGWQLFSMWKTFDRDRIEVDLRLGRYASAVEIVRRADDLDPDLRALVQRSATLGGPPADPPDFERRARAALRRGSKEEAIEWLALGGLRGDVDLALLAEALAAEGADPRDLVPPELYRAWEDDLVASSQSAR
jgi:hypothetical protein